MTIRGEEFGQVAFQAENNPVLLSLPPRRVEKQTAMAGVGYDASLEQLQAIETGSGPKMETALMTDLLARHLGLDQVLADPVEVHIYHNPLASVNAYKHRLHALRCEYLSARLRIDDLETQLNQSRNRVGTLEKHVQYLDDTLEQMRASRAWKLVEMCSSWRRFLSAWLSGRTRDPGNRT
jgi:hypothetical protein